MNLFDWLVCKQSIPMNGERLNNPNYSSNFYPVVGKTQNSSRIWGWLFMKLDESENAACRSSMVKSWGPLVNSQIAGLAGYEYHENKYFITRYNIYIHIYILYTYNIYMISFDSSPCSSNSEINVEPVLLHTLHWNKLPRKYGVSKHHWWWISPMQYIGWYNVGKTMPFSPPITGTGNHNIPYTTYKNVDDWGMVYCCFTHITPTCQCHVDKRWWCRFNASSTFCFGRANHGRMSSL